MKRRHHKPGTVAGLSGDHLGMVVRIAGVDYRLTSLKQYRRGTQIWAEWDDPDNDDAYIAGGLDFPAATPCTVVWWGKWFRPTMRERLRELNAGTTTKA